ncbi:hypothetical protein LWI28_005346 [Acer negundo]|uniref:Uncharacterized protein n=1 Tax=Acer negundo TaxID=4023 RepID=A0AAD5NLB1_ACENE|nr:hypothetical protein LWI28_005346 [Acer negundo]
MNCDYLDEGSVRCVQQQVMEAREKLLKSFGHEKFVKLGFRDMGEEVSGKWSEAEEQVFHEVVYSNPVSSGDSGEIIVSHLLLGIWSEVDSPSHKIMAALGFTDENAKELESLCSKLGDE